ncbi:hypothetical protein EN994_00455 [Mesorhizobium sp. M7A.F.Ca.CA.002.09.1.1]|nr:hypothetical protein EN994_00455 [Mesorhizobium sp. M7A.F.Ca.CA.002.09.1.1]
MQHQTRGAMTLHGYRTRTNLSCSTAIMSCSQSNVPRTKSLFMAGIKPPIQSYPYGTISLDGGSAEAKFGGRYDE